MTEPEAQDERDDDTLDSRAATGPSDESVPTSGSLKPETPSADESTVYDGTGGLPRMTWSSVTDTGAAPRAPETTRPTDVPSSFRFDLGGALARLGGDEPMPAPDPVPPEESGSSESPAESPIGRPDERPGASVPISPPRVEPTLDRPYGQLAADQSLFTLKPLPTPFATGSTTPADRDEPLVDLSGLPTAASAAPDVHDHASDQRAAPGDQDAEIDQVGGAAAMMRLRQADAERRADAERGQALDRRDDAGPSGVPVDAPDVDDLPNYPRRIPGTHLDRRHVADDPPSVETDVPEIKEATPVTEAPRPVARTSVFQDQRVDKYDPGVRGTDVVSSTPGRAGVPTLPASNPAAPPPIVEPVSNSTSTTDMTALRSAQLKAQRQQRQGKLFGRTLIAFVVVAGLIAAALVFGRSLLFTTEWDAQLTPIVNEIEAERGASFAHTVGLESLDATEFGDRLRAATIGDAWVDHVPAWRALNLTTGIVTAELVAAEMAKDTLARYDADGDVILVVADTDPDDARSDLRLALEAAYVAQNGTTPTAADAGQTDVAAAAATTPTGFAGVSPVETIATRAVDNFLANTATTTERRPASETLPIPIAYQLAAVKTLGESILVAADVEPASLSVGESYPDPIGDALDDEPMITASALLQPGERSLADPVALGNDDWSLVWSTRLPAATVDQLVDQVVADSYRPIDRDGRTCVVSVFQTADEPGGVTVLAALSSWASAAPAASNAVASQLGPTRLQLEVCDPGAENGVAAPAGVADGLIDRQQARLTN